MKSRSSGSRKKQLGNHQKSWLWGRHAVLETLRAVRWPILELFISEELGEQERDELGTLCRDANLEFDVSTSRRLEELCHAGDHQGYLARMSEFPYETVASGLEVVPENAFYVILDHLQDPHNMGAIIRSAEIFGVDAVIFPARGQVGVTCSVARSSAGAVNRVPLIQADDLSEVFSVLKDAGVLCLGASEKSDCSVIDQDLQPSIAIVMGNEGKGLSAETLAACSRCVSIPQTGEIGSLNAAAAAAVMFYEVRRQRS